METHLRTELVLTALEMAIGQRKPHNVDSPQRSGQPGGTQMVVATPEGRSCDEEAQAAFGSVWSGAIVLTRSPGGGRTR